MTLPQNSQRTEFSKCWKFKHALLPSSNEQRGLRSSSFWCPIPSLSRRGRCCSTQASLGTSVNTLLSGLSLRGFLSHQGTKTTWAMAFPLINCRTTTATVLTATATVTLSLRACLCFLLSHLLSQVHRRQKQLSDFVETKKYWTLPKSCGTQSSEWEERNKSRAKRGSLCTRDGSRKTVTCHCLRVVEPVYHQALWRQMEELEEERKKSRAWTLLAL